MLDLKPIPPLMKEDYISPHLEEEQKKREIKPLPKEGGANWLERIWLWLVQKVTEFLRKYG